MGLVWDPLKWGPSRARERVRARAREAQAVITDDYPLNKWLISGYTIANGEAPKRGSKRRGLEWSRNGVPQKWGTPKSSMRAV